MLDFHSVSEALFIASWFRVRWGLLKILDRPDGGGDQVEDKPQARTLSAR